MKIEIDHVKSAPEYVTITKRLYTQLSQKAGLYDDYKAAQRKRAKLINDILTPEQRSERCRKAAIARWNKQHNTEVK